MTIRNPVEWSADGVRMTALAVRTAFSHDDIDISIAPPEVRRIEIADLGLALNKGWHDFLAYRTDVIFICFIYPLAGLVVARVSLDINQLPLLFPLVSGFALIGPCAAAGLYEMSRRHERGQPVSWIDAFGVFRSPAIIPIVKLGLILTGIFLLWVGTAMGLYRLTLGPAMPASLSAFAADVFTSKAGWALIVFGVGTGFLFALLVLAISVMSFPLLIERRVSLMTAMRTSVRAVALNKGPMLVWGLIVACALVLGAVPAMLGLIVVVPVLGHATWHLYRQVVI